ncbi:MAG: nuclear transport factor 2 family protein, partial [Pseudomonadota bacterium]
MSADLNQANKRLVYDLWQALDAAPADEAPAILPRFAIDDATWHGPAPLGDMHGNNAYARRYWQPLRDALSGFERETHILMGGRSNGRIDGQGDGRHWVAGTGYFSGVFARELLGVAATNARVKLRWGEFCRVDNGRIVESFFLLDVIDFLQQAGVELLPPARG